MLFCISPLIAAQNDIKAKYLSSSDKDLRSTIITAAHHAAFGTITAAASRENNVTCHNDACTSSELNCHIVAYYIVINKQKHNAENKAMLYSRS